MTPAERAYQLAPWQTRVAGQFAAVLMRTGNRARAEALIELLRQAADAGGPALGMMVYHLVCADIDRAADWMEKAIERREPLVLLYTRGPLAAGLRASARWPTLARMLRFPESIGLAP